MSLKIFRQAIKSLGQNFLIDPGVVYSIVAAIAPQPGQEIIEIGPGYGAITKGLLLGCDKLLAIEIDRNLVNDLGCNFAADISRQKLTIINKDVLRIDFLTLPLGYGLAATDPLKLPRVVGNLPYNISSPLLFKLFEISKYLQDFHFLLQQEFVARLVAMPGNKSRGRLSVMAQYHADFRWLFDVAADAFMPKPKVLSSLVQIIPHRVLPTVAINYQLFSDIVAAAFIQRRKVITNSLKKYCVKQELIELNIDPDLRAEQLSVADFVKIANSVAVKL